MSKLFFLIFLSGAIYLPSCGGNQGNIFQLDAEPVYSNANNFDNPYIAVIGDSISTGVLANTQAGQDLESSFWFQIIWLLFSDWQDPNAIHKALSSPSLAAATTDAGFGLKQALKSSYQLAELSTLSVAKFGAKSTSVDTLLETLRGEIVSKPKPRFVYVMLGGNDFCSDQTLEEFQLHYNEALGLLHTEFPESSLIVAPLPPIYQLRDLDKTSIQNVGGKRRAISCDQLRMMSCERIYASDAKERTLAMNQIVEKAFSESAYPVNQKLFVREMLDWNVTIDELAADCFHPSAAGQETLGLYLNQAIHRLTE